MIKNEKSRVWVNRIVSFLCGGLLVLLIGSAAVVTPMKGTNAALKSQLDEIQNGAPRLLSEAKAFVENKNYDGALKSLDTLFAQQPTSNEAVEGKKLYATIETTVRQKNQKWEAASGALRASWEKTTATEMRGQLEKNMPDTLSSEWEKAKDAIKKEWEDRQI